MQLDYRLTTSKLKTVPGKLEIFVVQAYPGLISVDVSSLDYDSGCGFAQSKTF